MQASLYVDVLSIFDVLLIALAMISSCYQKPPLVRPTFDVIDYFVLVCFAESVCFVFRSLTHTVPSFLFCFNFFFLLVAISVLSWIVSILAGRSFCVGSNMLK